MGHVLSRWRSYVAVSVALLNDEDRSPCSSNKAIEYARSEQPTQPATNPRGHGDEIDFSFVNFGENFMSQRGVGPGDACPQVRQL
jgi:hypothetical protein